MQIQLTIECRIDVKDPERLEAIKKRWGELACEGLEYTKFVSMGDELRQTPQIAYFGDDFFSGHEEIEKLKSFLPKKEDYGFTTKEVNDDLVNALQEMNAQK